MVLRGGRAVAEEVVQETWVAVIQGLDRVARHSRGTSMTESRVEALASSRP